MSFCPFVLCALCSHVLPRCSQATLQLPLRPLELQLAAAPRIGSQDLLQGKLQSAVQMRGDLQREYCAQRAGEGMGSASKLQRSAVQRRAPRSFRAAALLSARMQQQQVEW